MWISAWSLLNKSFSVNAAVLAARSWAEQALLSEDIVLVKIDISNAYNSVSSEHCGRAVAGAQVGVPPWIK